MARVFRPARWVGSAPESQSMAYTAAQTFQIGEVLKFAAAKTVEVAAANPQAVVGVSLDDAASKPGYEVGHSSQVNTYTGRVAEVSVALASRSTVFSGAASSTVALTNVDVAYGLALSSNVWTVDLTETGTTSVEVTDIDLNEDITFFKFLEAVLDLP